MAAVSTDAGELDALVRRIDPDRWLSSRFIADRAKRADVVALYAYDYELARAEKVASNPLIAEIRLTWWREVLEEIFAGQQVRAHPIARGLALAVRCRGLPREPLEAMIDGRVGALGRTELGWEDAQVWADEIGGSAAVLASHILDAGSPSDGARRAGRAWGLLMLRRSAARAADLDEHLRAALAVARAQSRRVSAMAFPAIAAVALVKSELIGSRPSALGVRLRLLVSVLRGVV